ncbi:unnamed protein product [Ceutorhynchus assimilis]|uniref:Protein Skeletor n=1 Tax=Ceutorhynchus assimilis TaxID=467358 RepID=A0A9N9MPQ0_9CUCU|nr:unnamed protein product [Ceutorhynchus assimilis]
MIRSLSLWFLLFSSGLCQDDEDGPYKGKFLGQLNSYHHQVSGDVYAVDKYTLLLTSFNYDGNGADTFFWAGAANRPGPQGFIVPDENGRTNVLKRYFNQDFTLVLPDKKKITEIKWLAIYDIGSQNTFGDIYIPEEFEPPSTQKIAQLTGKNSISTISVEIVDAKQIKITGLTYDGKATGAYFWVGVGTLPVSKGFKVPDEHGYLDPLKSYKNKTLTLELPGDLTIFNINWFSIFDHDTNTNLGSILIPDALNVPPSLVKIIPYKDELPNCLQLHKNFQVSWEIFGPAITIQLAGMVDEDEYLAFGISGSPEKSQMVGADVAVAYIDGYLGYATDYNITALTPCVKVLGQYKGVCKDELVGGQNTNQMHNAIRENGINTIKYRRSLISPDNGDKEFLEDSPVFIVWAMGKLDENKEPAFHDFYPKTNISIKLKPKEPQKTCYAFTRSEPELGDPWSKAEIFDKGIRHFTSTIGPSGGKKAYQAITNHTSTALAWYINGFLAPELWLRRGLSYVFKVHGGNNPHNPEYYHPMIITDDPHGGYDRLTDVDQSKIRVLAGVEYSRRGRPRPTASGSLCLSKYKDTQDRRLDDDFESFKYFNRSLEGSCEAGEPGRLEFTPNSSWPDVVYYNSFTQANMGWKIHIIDSFNQRTSNSATNFSDKLILSFCMVIIYHLL